MEKGLSKSKANRKRVFKTEKGIEIKPMLHKEQTSKIELTNNVTYYYAIYYERNGTWNVFTNPKLYGETKIIDSFTSKENAIRTAKAINKSMNLLFENIK